MKILFSSVASEDNWFLFASISADDDLQSHLMIDRILRYFDSVIVSSINYSHSRQAHRKNDFRMPNLQRLFDFCHLSHFNESEKCYIFMTEDKQMRGTR